MAFSMSVEEVLSFFRDALDKGQFVPYFQPQVNILDGTVSGIEALVRWQHPERGLIMPGVFIPVLEKSGLIFELDRHMWRAVCRQARAWKDEGMTVPPISVNISCKDVEQDELLSTLLSCVKDASLDPRDIRLEITESAYIDDPERLKKLIYAFKDAGFTIEMDDFGTGYSSLALFKDLPFDVVKLDRSLLLDTGKTGKAGSILTALVHLAQLLDIGIIAEGVEEERQAEYLKTIGCYQVQGYLYSRPVPADACRTILLERHISGAASSQEPVRTYSDFLDYRTQEDILFNEYVGAAAIFEYTDKSLNVLRCNDRFFAMLGIQREAVNMTELSPDAMLEPYYLSQFTSAAEQAVRTNEDQAFEVALSPVKGADKVWIHGRLHLLSRLGDNALLYCDGINTTEAWHLRASLDSAETLYQSIIDQTNAIVLLSDIRTDRLLLVNRAAESFFGLPGAELMKHTYYDLWGLPRRKGGDRHILREGDAQTEDFVYRGHRMHAHVTFIRWGTRDAIIGYISDYTDLMNFTSRMTGVLDDLPCGVAIFEQQNGEWTRYYTSENCARILDYDCAADAPQGFLDVAKKIHPDDLNMWESFIRSFNTPYAEKSIEFRLLRRDGSIRWISFSQETRYNTSSGKTTLYGVYSDITDKNAAQEKLCESEERYRAAAMQSNNMICTYDIPTRTLDISQEKAIEFDSVTRMEDAPDAFIRLDYIAYESRDAWLGLFRSIERGQPSGRIPEIGIRTLSSGEMRWYNASFTLLPSSRTAVLAFDDITDARAARLESAAHISNIESILRIAAMNTLEYLVLIDTASSSYTMYTNDGKNTHAIKKQDDFDRVTRQIRDTTVVPEEREIYYSRANLSTVVRNLESYGTYRYQYTLLDGRREAEFHWLNDEHRQIVMTVRNVQRLFEAEASYQAEHKRLQLMNESVSSGPWSFDFDATGNITRVHWSREFREMLGFADTSDFPDELHSWADRLHPGDRYRTLTTLRRTISDRTNNTPYDLEFRVKNKAGEYHWYHASGRITRDDAGLPLLMAGTFIDISKIKELEQDRALESRRYSDTLRLARIGTWLLEKTPGRPEKLRLDDATRSLMGFADNIPEETCYREWVSRVDPGWTAQVLSAFDAIAQGNRSEITYLWNHPTEGAMYIRFSGYRDETYIGEGYRISGYHQIVDESVHREMQLTEQLKEANYDRRRDALTGLYNRFDLDEVFRDISAGRRAAACALVMLDIDSFKLLNDHYGHIRGDECLRAIGSALRDFGEKNEMRFYRYGGEEMLGLCFGTKWTPAQTGENVRALIYDLALTRDDTPTGRVTVSVGCTGYDADPNRMLDRADKLLYVAKDGGKNRSVSG